MRNADADVLQQLPSLALAFGILKMPESPRWLIMQGRLGDAKSILLRVSNSKEEAEIRFSDIKAAAGIPENCTADTVKLSTQTRGEGVWKELLLRPTPPVRWMLLAAVGIHFFEHATGIEAVVLYSPRIFKKAGVHSKHKLLLATVKCFNFSLTFQILNSDLRWTRMRGSFMFLARGTWYRIC
ncbi:major facilitator superfamily protein [Actinidia rufa]|uniref:Major facilitator superfamily protein n=1 Tax=Actinidia rufa TaxID=165716 RepID=A0A7J0HE56_9ERIC|nr:major facilitator superfamily protein [Actinidia rufa]